VDVNVPSIQSSEVAESLEDAIKTASRDEVDFFVLDVSISYANVLSFVSVAERYNVNIIVRLGLLPDYKILNLLSESSSVLALVCVEREVYEVIKDHKASRKSLIMPNPIALDSYINSAIPVNKRENSVVYMGSLVPQKGFLRLARIWKSVIEVIPDAKLLVLGSGTLYGRGNKLGKWGVASEEFEKTIRKYLSDENGNIHKSVNFLGNLGKEKNDILSKAVVGIANPTGETETFCLAAVEIQANYTPVIAGKSGGLFDTVNDKNSGYLISSEVELRKKIIFLLKNKKVSYEMGLNGRKYIDNRYYYQKIASKWDDLFESLSKGGVVPKDEYLKYGRGLMSKISTINLSLERNIFFPGVWPSTMHFYFYFMKLVGLRRKFLNLFLKNEN
jgi:glycosyltransferase involved in cell wall biosynthesis